MDPATVAGLTSSIITFLDCSIKLAKLTKQVYEAHGELPKELKECQTIVDEFSGWIQALRSKESSAATYVSIHNVSLSVAIDHCIEDCDELLQIYQSLLPKNAQKSGSTSGKTISNIKMVLKALKREGRIEKMKKRLEMHKNQLRLCMAERTMDMVEQSLKIGYNQIELSRSIKDIHLETRDKNRQMHMELGQQMQQQSRDLELNLKSMHSAGREEILACLAQHSLQFDQLHTSLGMVELDLESIQMKSDDTLLLVKQLVNAVNSKGSGSSAIYVQIPRALYDPGLAIWRGYKAYIDRASQFQVPGGWAPEISYVQDRQIGTFSGDDARATYLAVASFPTELDNISWTRNLIGPTWSTRDFKAAYGKNQSWLSYLLCYEMVGVKAVPVNYSGRDNKDSAEERYRTWTEVLRKEKLIKDSEQTSGTSHSNKHQQGDNSHPSEKRSDHGESQTIGAQKLQIHPIIEPQVGIQRRTSGDLDVPAEEAQVAEWLRRITSENIRETTRQLEPLVELNKQLQSVSSIPEDSDTMRRGAHLMLQCFEERSSHQLPELVQMMTTEAGSELDKNGSFKWGFQLVVQRNDVNLQLVGFMSATALIWLCDPLSSEPARYILWRFHGALCDTSSASTFRPWIFSVRMCAVTVARATWINYQNYLIAMTRFMGHDEKLWRSALKRRDNRNSTKWTRRAFTLMYFASAASCSRWASILIGVLLNKVLSVAWMVFISCMVVSSLWSLKDWFEINENKHLRKYRLGVFLSIILLICTVLSALQNSQGQE
ncbi:hypothetical protein HJFPF1_10259 [Paramyrothecium foliicola]|nr:hypothetical protein HJFPF1_10259 [Paramyrothecium foliicola]